jgi:hypothetical protein
MNRLTFTEVNRLVEGHNIDAQEQEKATKKQMAKSKRGKW